jgi:hypothetical protein
LRFSYVSAQLRVFLFVQGSIAQFHLFEYEMSRGLEFSVSEKIWHHDRIVKTITFFALHETSQRVSTPFRAPFLPAETQLKHKKKFDQKFDFEERGYFGTQKKSLKKWLRVS